MPNSNDTRIGLSCAPYGRANGTPHGLSEMEPKGPFESATNSTPYSIRFRHTKSDAISHPNVDPPPINIPLTSHPFHRPQSSRYQPSRTTHATAAEAL